MRDPDITQVDPSHPEPPPLVPCPACEDCPVCRGDGLVTPDEADAYLELQRVRKLRNSSPP